MLDKKHLSFLIDKFVTILLIFWSLNGYRKSCSLPHINLLLHFGVDGECTGLDVCLTYLAETTFSCGSVLLPDLHAFVFVALVDLALFLLLLKREDLLIGRNAEGIVFVVLIIE